MAQGSGAAVFPSCRLLFPTPCSPHETVNLTFEGAMDINVSILSLYVKVVTKDRQNLNTVIKTKINAMLHPTPRQIDNECPRSKMEEGITEIYVQ